MLVPTIPRPYTVGEVEADPVPTQLATRDLHEFRQPARSLRVRGAVGHARRRLALERDPDRPCRRRRPHRRRRRRVQSRSGAPMGATGLRRSGARAAAARGAEGRIELAVVGAHLAGLPLNRELVDARRGFRCARSRRATTIVSTRCRNTAGKTRACCASRDGAGAAIKAESLDARSGGRSAPSSPGSRRRWASARSS